MYLTYKKTTDEYYFDNPMQTRLFSAAEKNITQIILMVL